MNHLLLKRLAKPLQPLHEGERGYGSWHFNAPAGEYHGVMQSPGAMEGVGPQLGNDSRLLENHLRNLQLGEPVSDVVQDLLETGKHRAKARQSPYMRAMSAYAATSKMHVYQGPIR